MTHVINLHDMLPKLFTIVIYFIARCHFVALIENFDEIQRYTHVQPRIAKGKDAKIEEVPYVVRIVFGPSICTGAIINESWVLTAAHCVDTKETIMVHAGVDNKDDKTGQERKALKAIKHDDYWKGKISKYDVALLKVEPFELNDKVGVIKLSDEVWPQGKTKYKRPCLAAGWGVPEIGQKVVSRLQKLEVLARHGENGCKCWQTFQNKRLVCLNGKTGIGACKGDSGSALVCGKKAVGVAHMIYLVDSCNPFSFGRYDFKCSETSSAYMYICPHLDWIKNHVPNVPAQPTSCKGIRLSNNFVHFTILIILLNLKLSSFISHLD